MAIKWKTTIKYPNWSQPNPTARESIEAQCQVWLEAGKYTGGFAEGPYDGPDGRAYHRWWWSDETTASEYAEQVELALPGLEHTLEITSEEVPD